MTLIALPTGFCPNMFNLRMKTSELGFGSPYGGSEQVVDKLNDRWLLSLSLPNRTHAQAAAIEAFIGSLRGMTNTVALYHWVRKVPRGSMRGAPKTNGVLQGAKQILIFTTPAATLLAGDMFGAGGLLFQVESDCVADGAGNLLVPIINRVRKALPALTDVVWDRPTAPFRLASPSSVQYVPGYAPEVAFDFVEAIG
ncbi:hypothetical protein J2W30_003707 [Variovorax boronicumulans]|uniref:hypothetical protein n=1 Tax=Variovorax boronicumulans TaxID=436515 RepID=UPI002785A300|nr:hypothetical protein [Variovorax boronicumulans]MDQ0035934.1 hypothetical protein [Variovorax boronicumulans]